MKETLKVIILSLIHVSANRCTLIATYDTVRARCDVINWILTGEQLLVVNAHKPTQPKVRPSRNQHSRQPTSYHLSSPTSVAYIHVPSGQWE